MVDSENIRKKSVISWIAYALSVILLIVQMGISFSPADDTDLVVVAVLLSVIGLVNIVILVFGTILFIQRVNNEKKKNTKKIGIILRVLVSVPVVLLTLLWIVGIFK